MRFGRWLIVSRIGYKKGATYWLCRCDCGVEREVAASSLKAGTSLSCGCYRIERISLDHGEASFNRLYSSYQKFADYRGYAFSIDEAQFRFLTSQKCHYCGVDPSNEMSTGDATGSYTYSGLDRQDNNRDYTIDNVVSCCRRCNRAKDTYDLSDFKEWIVKVYEHIKIV